MRITITTVSLLLAVSLLAGCGDNDDANGNGPSQESSGATSASASPSASPSVSPSVSAEADRGVEVARSDYTFNLPKDWIDSTDDQALAGPEDAYGSVAVGADHRVTVDAEPDVSQELFDHGLKEMVGNMKRLYASNGKQLADTTWAGEAATHVQGSGQASGTRAQVFYFRHENTAYIICVQTPGSQAQNEAAVDALRSSWTWK
ncbi:hypothetical protein ncot_05885 [Nocardioides sp. JQ2195]|uniref:hypothetical protein n=1 Tax=Nocardioides sp. JQ2195 TaxID=2592334 RepID=UPI00143E79E2|nr:hypothetical protein [Nocardioides sp. JQ2195]QIX26183.1 hypothetical protein ncot_05885 [Nocardioides sp. JQ2195]